MVEAEMAVVVAEVPPLGVAEVAVGVAEVPPLGLAAALLALERVLVRQGLLAHLAKDMGEGQPLRAPTPPPRSQVAPCSRWLRLWPLARTPPPRRQVAPCSLWLWA